MMAPHTIHEHPRFTATLTDGDAPRLLIRDTVSTWPATPNDLLYIPEVGYTTAMMIVTGWALRPGSTDEERALARAYLGPLALVLEVTR